MIEFICSAIRFKSLKTKGWYELYDQHHNDIVNEISKQKLMPDYLKEHIDGFIIKENGKKRFVDVKEATKIAKKLGIEMRINNQLSSQDLW